ncbi:circadian clock protein KaiC [Aureimonas sp. Leaf454]|uniref:ATPase domain-containing protein n=1 Tax=Aureimonas sp. Leaf454 TaxID=1736381 RepID=UPI0006FB934A|nr:ATPase domain-containing protein [Aureimonas sp. Leaf454]KQT54972.1 circadian clock protein KaiC [Aureimonas sp. Leaf454]
MPDVRDDLTPVPRLAEAPVSTGIAGLDHILGAGLTPDRLYLVEGTPGTGKTTLSLQFLLAGVAAGESGLYITLSETAEELRAVAATHGWSLDALSIFELVGEDGLDPDSEQSILHPSEVELGETTKGVMRKVEEMRPRRVVFDSLSEMRLLAQNPLRYRRQILALKQFFSSRRCTVLMLDDRTSDGNDLQLHSIAHGVISLEQNAREFGPERRRLRVVKMRGIKFRGGYHDFNLDTGGLLVFPRLVAAEHHKAFDGAHASTGNEKLDALLGGGLAPGTNTLLSGPSGVGKTTTAVRCMLAALQRGEKATYYLFDEGLGTLMSRSAMLGMDIRPFLESGQLALHQIDPAELSPGEFTSRVRHAVEAGSRFLVVDSLNAYLHAMPGEQFLLLQMHEILTYLSQQGVTTLLILGQHGLVGDMRSDIDLSYLSDAILLFRFFEAQGKVRTAIAAVKSRTSAHERAIREFRLGPDGLTVGDSLNDFEGVLTGLPSYKGGMAMLNDDVLDGRPE